MMTRTSKLVKDFQATQKKTKSVLQELEESGLLRNQPLRGRKFKVPTMFDRGISPNFTCPFSPIKREVNS